MTKNKHFVNEMETKIDSWHKEIQKFKIIAEVAEPDAQIKHYQVIEDITKKVIAVEEKLDEFKASDAVNRESLKNEIVTLQQGVDDTIERARVKVN